jgi:hypothetical protein
MLPQECTRWDYHEPNYTPISRCVALLGRLRAWNRRHECKNSTGVEMADTIYLAPQTHTKHSQAIIHDRVSDLHCIFTESDSMILTGWLYKRNFAEEDKLAVFMITQKLGDILLEAGVCLYSQWFAGILNKVTDSLSMDHSLDDVELTSFFIFALPHQTPHHFEINLLPSAVCSFLISLTAVHTNRKTQTVWA